MGTGETAARPRLSNSPTTSAEHALVDIKREPPKKTKRNLLIAGAIVAVVATTLALSNLEARPPGVSRSELWVDSVQRGTMIYTGVCVIEGDAPVEYSDGPGTNTWRFLSTRMIGKQGGKQTINLVTGRRLDFPPCDQKPLFSRAAARAPCQR